MSAPYISIDNMIRSMVDSFCVEPGKALLLTLDFRIFHYGNDREYGASKMAHFMFHRRNKHGSCNTFFALEGDQKKKDCDYQNENMFWYDVPLEKWENISNHDSCWADATSTKLHQIFVALSDDVIAQCEADGVYEKRTAKDGKEVEVRLIPISLSHFIHIHTLEKKNIELKKVWADNGRDYQIETLADSE